MLKKIRKKKIKVFLIAFAISMLGLYLNERYVKNSDYLFYTIILTVCVSIVVTTILSCFESFLGNNIDDIAEYNFRVLKTCNEYGLQGIYKLFPLDNDEVKKDFVHSREVFIVMNDAKSFISNNPLIFEDRVKNPFNKTYFILQDYTQNDIMKVLTRKNGHEDNPKYYIDKIKNVIKYDIEKILFEKKNSSHDLIVYLNSNYNTLGIVLTDNFAMVSLYRVSSGKSSVPHFIFKKGFSEYECVKKDVCNIIKASKRGY